MITPTSRPHRRPPGALVAPLIGAFLLLPVSPLAPARDTRGVGERDAIGPAPVAPSVEPVGDWYRLRDIVWRDEAIGLHIRTGYARPIVFPEPVALAEAVALPGCKIEIDIDVASFSPRRHFDARIVAFVGLESGRIYRYRIRSSEEGKRVPIRMVVR